MVLQYQADEYCLILSNILFLFACVCFCFYTEIIISLTQWLFSLFTP